MKKPENPDAAQPPLTGPESLFKVIVDLDDLLQSLRRGIRTTTPLGRLLYAQLAQADEQMLLARITIAMEKSRGETRDAFTVLYGTLRAADAHLNQGRSDAALHAAVKLAAGLAQRVCKELDEET